MLTYYNSLTLLQYPLSRDQIAYFRVLRCVYYITSRLSDRLYLNARYTLNFRNRLKFEGQMKPKGVRVMLPIDDVSR